MPLFIVIKPYIEICQSFTSKQPLSNNLSSRALKSQYFVYFQLNHAASRLVRNELCAFIELIFSENKHFE